MRTGTLISGAAHAALIAAVVLGVPWLSPGSDESFAAVSVDFISEAEFEAALSGSGGSRGQLVLPPERAVEPELPVTEAEPPAPETIEPPVSPAQEIGSLATGLTANAPLRMPTGELSPVSQVRIAPEPPGAVEAPRPRPVERIAAITAPKPPDDARNADAVLPEIAPQPDVRSEQPQRPVEAPAEAAPEPQTEPSPVALQALTASVRPKPRRVSEPAADPEPAAEPDQVRVDALAELPVTEAAEPAEVTEGNDAVEQTLQSTIESLVASATPETEPVPAPQTGTGVSDGLPLSASDRDAFRLKVQSCWNFPAELRNAAELRVIIGAELDEMGNILSGSVRIVEPDPIPDERFRTAYEAGRRALLRCSPYTTLPKDRFATWRRIEAVFDPKGMVSW